jgi:hypothetical protein
MAWMFPALILSQGLVPAAAPDTGSPQPRWIDVDADGRLDFHLVGAAGTAGAAARQRLFFAEADVFREATASELAGIESARFALWSDLDRDGLPELLTGTPDGTLRLARAPRGVLEPYEVGLEQLTGVRTAAWVDFDQDGWTDLWVQRESDWALLANRAAAGGRTFELLPGGRLASATAPPPSGLAGAAESSTALPPDGAPADAAEDSASAAGTDAAPAARLAGRSPLPGVAPPTSYGATFTASCARTLLDVSSGVCLSASSAPSLGKLYPLSSAFNVDPAGRIGVGTLAPTHRLTVSAPDDDALRLIGAGAFGSQSRLNFGDGDFVYLYEDDDDALEIHTEDGLRITGGNVGIGTLFPGWPLHVVGTQGVGRFDSTGSALGSVIELRNQTAGATDVGAINFVNSLGQYNGQIAYKGNDALAFRAGGVERLRIDASGRVGIGTTLPAAVVDVAGTTSSDVLRVVNNGSDDALVASAAGSSARALVGVHGGTGNGIGVHAITGSSSQFAYALFCVGNLGATGTKSFVQPHPSDPSKEVRFVCLEGNESGTYFRGSARLAGGRAVIDVPEEFRLVTGPEGLTVQVTPIGAAVPLAVESYDLEHVTVVGSADVEFHYFVNGVRRGFTELECVRENHAYVPEERGVPYGAQYPDELRRILVENGTLNPDFTPSEATAARLGWELRDPAPSARRTGGSR